MNNHTRNHFRGIGGFGSVEDLLAVSLVKFEEAMNDLSKQAQAIKLQPNNEGTRPVYGYAVKRKLLAFRAYLGVIRAQGTAVDQIGNAVVDAFDQVQIQRYVDWMNALAEEKAEDSKAKDVPKLDDFNQWYDFKEYLEMALDQTRNSSLGTPLSYLIREHTVVTDEMRAEEFASLDQVLINTVVLEGTAYQHDNKVLFDMLKDLTLQGNAWEFIAGFNRSKDGRAAWLALKAQAEGPQASETRKQKAYADIAKAHYNGTGRFTLQSYITKHLAAHNVLRKEGETISENKKVTDFLRGIQDSRLDTAKQIVQSRADLMADFTLCQQHMATALATLQASAPASSRRQIGATGTTSTGKHPKDDGATKGKKRPKGNGPGQDGKNRRNRKRSKKNDDWHEKSKAEQDEIKAQRAAKRAQREIAALIQEGQTQKEFTQNGKKVEIRVSSIESTPTSPQAQESDCNKSWYLQQEMGW